ncbi:MAG: nucleotidyltransferase domain-containing protein [archaeon]
MEQICYSIVSELVKQDNHIRGLAKALKTNQMTMARKMRYLEEKNIVDYRKEGRNKVYFMKGSLEAEEYKSIVEHNKLMEIIAKNPRIRAITHSIKAKNNIILAILFGSFAKGTAAKESDIDIYIETENSKIKEELQLLDSKISVKIGSFDKENLLIKEIIKNHIILKGVDRYNELIH